MIQGADTSLLVVLEIREAPGHQQAWGFLKRTMLKAVRPLALAPQVLAEFIHIVTDPRRFENPLPMEEALKKADFWWNAEEVQQVVPDSGAVTLFSHWMYRYGLGRKRILDTMLAATYAAAGVRRIVSTNLRDYRVFEELEVVDPTAEVGGADARDREAPMHPRDQE
jgi:predicted nucleic acid-binding protein